MNISLEIKLFHTLVWLTLYYYNINIYETLLNMNSMLVNIIHVNVLPCYNNNIYIKNWVDKYNVLCMCNDLGLNCAYPL
jgi:hypothetical protein